MTEAWFSQWFEENYLRLYSHRGVAEATEQTKFVLDYVTAQKPPTRALDIACGTGRHLLLLANSIKETYGVDLSPTLLRHAVDAHLNAKVSPLLVRADMRRLPFAEGAFDLITNFFTSFGYFPSDEDHLSLLAEWRRVAEDNAVLVIDYLNKGKLLDSIVPESVDESTNEIVIQQRRITQKRERVLKKIIIRNLTTGAEKMFEESVRLYSLSEMTDLLSGSNFSVVDVFGDFAGHPFTEESERLVIFARAA